MAAAIAGLLAAALVRGDRPPAWPPAGLPGVLARVLLFTPMIFLLYIFLSLQMITVVCVGLLIGVAFILCGHFMDVAAHQRAWRVVALALSACAVISLAAGIVLSKPSSSHPRRDSLVYSLNADNHTAALITYDQALDSWTSQAFAGKTPVRKPAPEYLGGLSRPVFWASADPLDLAPPTAGMEKDEQDQGGRKVRLKITPRRKEAVTYLIFDQGLHPLSIKIGERTVKPAHTTASVRLYGLGGNPAELEFTFSPPAKISFWLLDQTTGLPKPAGPHPEGLIGNDDTIVCRKYDF